MATIARNAPCPCGSGKRYRACHGALTSPSVPPDPLDSTIGAVLDAALEAQQDRRFEEARRLYGHVLASVPNHFDAVHMLGVVHYQLGLLEDARRYLERAWALRPHSSAVNNNLRLVRETIERSGIEREICRNVLPRLQRLCAPATEFMTWLRSETTVHFVAGSVAPTTAFRGFGSLRALCAPAKVRPWSDGDPSDLAVGPDWTVLEAASGHVPRGGILVACAGPRTMAHWLDAAAPERAALMVSHDEPAVVIDRLRELTSQARRRAAVLYATPQVARAIGLSGLVVPEPASAAA